jgi:hypothetical protein
MVSRTDQAETTKASNNNNNNNNNNESKLVIGTCNVKTLLKPGNMQELSDEWQPHTPEESQDDPRLDGMMT